jgi:hypothetical protein
MTHDPAEAMDAGRRIEGLRKALTELPVIYREAVVLCDLQELSYQDAASVAGCAIGTVRSRLHRGRGLLAARLRGDTASGMERASKREPNEASLSEEPEGTGAKRRLRASKKWTVGITRSIAM